MMTTRVYPYAIALALLGLASPAVAQSVGVKGGVSVSTLVTSPDISPALSARTDVAGGLFVVADDRSPITFQLEGLFSRRGASLLGDVPFLDFGGLDLTFLDISGFVRVQVPMPSGQLYVFGGPTLGVKLDASADLVGFEQDIAPLIEDYETALTAGVGLRFGHGLIEGRYSEGLTNLVRGGSLLGFEARTRTVMVLAGFGF